jgi:hypothetical protein
VRFTTAAALASALIEARDEKHLLRFQKQLAAYELLIIEELGFVPLSKSGAELLFETLSQRYGHRFWSPATCPSTNGPRSSAPSGSPAPCWTGSPTRSTSWR